MRLLPARVAALLAAALTAALPPAARAADRPILVELFTSQGCSSCPPAEAVLLDIAKGRGNVLALGFHVDYWDRLGWKDPFSSPAATERQRRYASVMRLDQVYTPQMVVDGRRELIGSDGPAAAAAITAANAAAPAPVPLRLTREGEGLAVTIGAGRGAGTAWLVGFDPQRETPIRRGENAGRTILQANVVRSFESVAEWRGQEVALRRAMPPGERAALFLQAPDGRILGVTLLGG